MAHTTRAYMSEVAEDNPYAYDARMRAVDGYKVDYQNAAMSEASRILADVERPSVERQHYDWACFVEPGYQAHRMFSMAPSEREALAESLAAFVNDGGRA